MSASKSILNLIHHRSKNRIRDFGEVFTPEKYVNQMLDMLDKSVWTDANTIFYEPTCWVKPVNFEINHKNYMF